MLSVMQNSGFFDDTVSNKKTGIVFACESRSAYSVKYMLEQGCDPHEMNSWNEEAIIVAAKHNSVPCIRVLLEAGVSINTTSPNGKTILDYAHLHNNQDMLELINEYKHRPQL